jgi:hypothetical protein
LSRIELCPCQALDICHNVITHRTDIEDDDAYARKSSFLKTNHKNNCIYLIPWISQCAIDQIKCIIQTPNLIIIGFRITMVNETCIFCGFKPSKCLKGCFYLWITLIKKTYKGSHEIYKAHSYLGTDKIQTYTNTCVSRIGYVLINFRCIEQYIYKI